MEPVVHGLESEYAGQIDFVFLDIDDSANEVYKRQLGFRAQPHMFLLDAEGNVVGEWIGKTDSGALEAEFDKLLAQ